MKMALQLTSPEIVAGGNFPAKYTCNGLNVSPPLRISGVPEGAISLVLIFDDPDAAKEPAGDGTTFDHWLIYNIPAANQDIAQDSVPRGGKLGMNSMDGTVYIGPCPPTFRHKYIFRLLALDCSLSITDPPTKTKLEEAAKDHIMEEATLISYYEQP